MIENEDNEEEVVNCLCNFREEAGTMIQVRSLVYRGTGERREREREEGGREGGRERERERKRPVQ